VNLISDDDDEQDNKLESAIQASKHEASVAEQSSKSDNPLISTFLSERAQLEKERRERQKRLRTQSGLQDSEGESEGRPSKRHHFSSSVRTRIDSLPVSRSSTASSDSPTLPVPRAGEEELFFDGELRQTATQHGEPRQDGRPTFRLTQILGKV
jgi:tyrosyl-DNA phosphodiesterase-1